LEFQNWQNCSELASSWLVAQNAVVWGTAISSSHTVYRFLARKLAETPAAAANSNPSKIIYSFNMKVNICMIIFFKFQHNIEK
jgi:hypothetical protein